MRRFLAGLPGVTGVHDLHIWAMSTTEHALTAHLVMPQGHPGDAFVQGVVGTLRRDYSMHHATVQVEFGMACHACILEERGHEH